MQQPCDLWGACLQADSPAWFDLSPEAYDIETKVPNTQAANVIVQRYANMMLQTHSAVKQNQAGRPSMIYACVDRMWTGACAPGERAAAVQQVTAAACF